MMLLMCHSGELRFALPIHDVVEVVGRPAFDPLPASPSWVAGMSIHRGVVTPVIDFATLAGVGEARSLWSSRVIVLKCEFAVQMHRVGILFDRSHAEQVPDHIVSQAIDAAVQLWPWGKTLIDEHGTYCLLDLLVLLSPQRQALLFPSMD